MNIFKKPTILLKIQSSELVKLAVILTVIFKKQLHKFNSK